VRGNSHAGFGGRPAQTERPKGRHRAAGRPYLATKALDEVRREHWNELRRAGDRDAAKQFKDARWSLLKTPTTSPSAKPTRSPRCTPPAARSHAPGR